MKYRIFIAINLPEGVKTNLGEVQDRYPELPARWTKTENLHITLEFLGYIDDEALEEIKQIISRVSANHKSFSIKLTDISYAPPKTIPPRMVWAVGEPAEDFSLLKGDLEKEISRSEKIRFIPERKESIPHITLARIKEWEWRRIEPDERPEVGENINLSFEVKTVDLMESRLKRGGPEYKILQSYSLKSET